MRAHKIWLFPLLLFLAGGFAAPAFADSPTCVSPETKLSWPAVNPIWEMCWLPPNLSVGPDGSGMELRNVHFKGHLVMRRAHAPMLFAEYRSSTCYRDWKDDSVTFLSDKLVQNKLGIPVDPPAAITSCDRSQNPTAAYGNCPFQLPGYPNAAASCAKGLTIEDGGDHVTLTTQHAAAWYQYTARWTFYGDGRMHPEFGFGNNDGTNSSITHWHHNYWRMEFDIDNSGVNTASINGVDQATEFSDLRSANGGPGGVPRTWEVRNAVTGNGYKLVPGADDYTIPANESGRGFHTIDMMGTRQRNGEYGDRSDNPLSVCAMNQNALVNGESLLNTTIALYYRVSVRDATANNWPPGCSGASCIPQDSMICKRNGPTLIPFGPWVGGGTPLPTASVTPTSYSFKLVAGGSTSAALQISNTGAVGSTLTYTIGEAESSCANPSDVSWLGVTPSSGSVAGGLSGSASVTINTAGLATGSHSAKLCVASNDAAHALIEVPVSLVVSAVVEPAVTVTPMELAFTVPAGLKDSATLTIANTGTASSTLQWGLTEAVDDCFVKTNIEWLIASPNAGSIAANSSTAVNVAIDATTLEPGSYPALLCIVSNDPALRLVQVPVALTVKPNLPDDDGIFANGFEGSAGPQPVQDPSFEATTGDGGSNPFWSGTDSNDPGGTPFYGADFGIPVYEGKWEVWFGGWEKGVPETQSFSQTVTIPSGARRLNYWRLIDTPPEGTGRLRITVDAVEVANVDLVVPADDEFVAQSIDVSAFANGAAHTITFTFQHDGNGTDGNTFIDQVTIDAQVAARATVRPRVGHHDRRLTKKRR